MSIGCAFALGNRWILAVAGIGGGRRWLSVAFSKVLLWIFKFSVGKGKEGLRGYGNWI